MRLANKVRVRMRRSRWMTTASPRMTFRTANNVAMSTTLPSLCSSFGLLCACWGCVHTQPRYTYTLLRTITPRPILTSCATLVHTHGQSLAPTRADCRYAMAEPTDVVSTRSTSSHPWRASTSARAMRSRTCSKTRHWSPLRSGGSIGSRTRWRSSWTIARSMSCPPSIPRAR